MAMRSLMWMVVSCGLSWILAGQAALAADSRPDLRVTVSIAPEAFFVERISGGQIAVQVLIAPGESPASYDPTPQQMIELAQAEAYLRIGVPMESSLLPRLERGFPDLRIFDLRQGIDLHELEAASAGQAADHDGHQHGETDPHIWLSPRLARTIAANVAAALSELDPAGRAFYVDNLAVLDADLGRIDDEISAQLAPLRGRKLFVVHPAFGYFADDYGLVQVAIERGGLAPGARHMAEVLTAVRQEGSGALFIQPQFSTAAAQNLAEETGLQLVILDPLARDYLANLRAMANAISSALDPPEQNR